MTMKRHILLLTVAASILCSCTYGTRIGGYLSNLGVREAYNINTAPYTTQDYQSNSNAFFSHSKKELNPTPQNMRIYKLGDLYYMELYFQYAPIENGLARDWSPHGGLGIFLKTVDPYYVNLKKTPVEAKMVLMDKECVKNCLQIDVPEVPLLATRMIPVNEFDFSKAKRCKPNPEPFVYEGKTGYYGMSDFYYPEIPRQRRWYHYILEPLSWPITVVEYAPDAAIMTPVALITAPCAAVGQVQQQQIIQSPPSEEEPAKKDAR